MSRTSGLGASRGSGLGTKVAKVGSRLLTEGGTWWLTDPGLVCTCDRGDRGGQIFSFIPQYLHCIAKFERSW